MKLWPAAGGKENAEHQQSKIGEEVRRRGG
jgi:hypothetical protein